MIGIGHARHRLAVAVRIDDHFSQRAIADLIDVRLDTGERSVRAPDGRARHDDGTYRWINLDDGPRRLTVNSPNGRWTRFGAPAIDVVLPLAGSAQPVVVEMWPTTSAVVPPGITALRGKLEGPDVGGARVEIDFVPLPAPAVNPAASDRFTFADSAGEFVYFLPGYWVITSAGLLDLEVLVPGRTVTNVVVETAPAVTSGANFKLPPGRDTRVRVHVT